jgi:uncharacterized SAM-binding protein YcdF (DUF218 family)
LLLLVLLAVVAAATHAVWLGALGGFLVDATEPAPAEIAVVLAGDDSGRRIEKAAELIKKGFVPKALVSGPCCSYGLHENDLAIPFIVGKGYPEEWFIGLPMKAGSTRDEAAVVLPELRRRGIRSFLLVTSNYHTRRASSVYRALVRDGEQFRAIAAPDRVFTPEGWWRTRQGQKRTFMEWTKTVAYWLGY